VPPDKRLLYLHGLASSPFAQKARLLRERLAPELTVTAPDLNVPSFEALSFERMVEVAREAAAAEPPDVVLGSSLGALVALAASARGLPRPDVPLLLVAPALGLGERWLERLPARPPGAEGEGEPVPIFHFGMGRTALVHRRFFEEVARLEPLEAPRARVFVVMGREDQTVPCDAVHETWRRWATSPGGLAKGSRYLELADGDHGLVAHVGLLASLSRELATGHPCPAPERAAG
jgi:pimeloyl-ACP methyl ester carboxylesterase